MKSLILVLSCLLMSGCVYQTVNRYDLDEAEILCAKQQSHVAAITAFFLGKEEVTCANGVSIELHIHGGK